jgi:phage shock protein A
MDMQTLKDWGYVITALMTIGTFLYAWLTAGSKTNTTQLREVITSIDAMETRLTQIEAEMKHLPDEKALTELKLAISDMKGGLGRMEESMAGLARTTHRVEEYLLKKGTI